MKPNLSQKAMKLGPNDNCFTEKLLWIEFKLFISNWKRFDPAKAKKIELVFYFPSAKAWKYESIKPNLSQKALKLASNHIYIIYIHHIYIHIHIHISKLETNLKKKIFLL